MAKDTLKILCLADEMMNTERLCSKDFDDIDLILSCGDLPAWYLSLIADLSRKDLLYVPGNHDASYLHHPPLGCINIDDSIYSWHGLKILGLGGSQIYNFGPFQYSEKEMKKRFFKLWFKALFPQKIDILLTHSPAWNFNDGKDPAHQGYHLFHKIIKKLKPDYFIHGHVHLNYGDYPRLSHIGHTVVINAYGQFILEIPLKSRSIKDDIEIDPA